MTANKPRIAICGIHDECSTFSPHVATEKDFIVTRGQQLLDRYPWLTEPDGFAPEGAERTWAGTVEWVPIVHARAVPGGPIDTETYLAWRHEITTGLAALMDDGLDAIYFDIHGAMNVIGMDDAEGDLITAIRDVVGRDILIGATMDLHGNVPYRLFDNLDLMTCFRLAPHEDTWETRERGARDLVFWLHKYLAKGIKPAKALVQVPILLPGEMTSTRLQPAKRIYASIPSYLEGVGVDDVSLWIGYAWADEPRSMAAVVAFGENQDAVDEAALGLARDLWTARKEFCFVAPDGQFEECLAAALESTSRPYFISDSGDNPGAGGADDCTFTLGALLENEAVLHGSKRVIQVSNVDPDAVRAAVSAGVGSEATLRVGGKMDTRAPGEVVVKATVGAIAEDPIGGTTVRMDKGQLSFVVTEKRCQYSTLNMYRDLGIEPTQVDIIVVKIGYLEPELHAIQQGWMLALTPGGVDQDLIRLNHQRIQRPMFPFDPEMETELTIQH